MSEEEIKLQEALNQLAMETVMVEPEDMKALGSIMERLERIQNLGGSAPKAIQTLPGALKGLLEKIILREIPEPGQGIELLGKGVQLMQGKISSPQASPPEENAFWEKWKSLTGGTIPAATLQEKAPSATEAPAEEILDLSQDREIYTDFIAEALEHLATIELKIITLEQSPEDLDCINAIFRPFHTIKGVAGFLNLKEMNQFAHAMESLLDDARNHKLVITREVIDFILDAVDLLKKMILDLKDKLDSGQPRLTRFELKPYRDKIAQLREGKPSPSITSEPAAPSANQTAKQPLGEILSSQGVVSPQEVQAALEKQDAEKSGLKIGEILVQEKKASPQQVIEALREQKRPESSGETTIKVDTQKLDNLIDMVGELVIAQSQVQQNPALFAVHDQKLTRDFSQLKRITTDLQKISMSLRMIPIRQTFQKMIRLVRDLAKKSDKQVELIMSGEETEIDRTMVDMLYDPLVHMIRNSIDHGIESPQRRKEVGKPEMGKIFLRAFQKGGYIIIEIEDDGQGLNRPKILKKAQTKGMVPPDVSLTEYQIDNLIFEPGFSTVDKVTDISGRGVGMDVVKKTIERLKGKVEIFSEDGKGCRFVMRVPLTLAIMDGIVVQIGQERCLIPTVFIRETLRPARENIVTVQKKGELIKVRNSLVPLVRLYQLLGVHPQKKEPWEALIVLAENEGKQKGLMVDDLIGKQEVVIKNLGEKLKAVKGIAGATIMGDGRVGLIMDIHGIFEIAQTS